jgi:hypothetical protein
MNVHFAIAGNGHAYGDVADIQGCVRPGQLKPNY